MADQQVRRNPPYKAEHLGSLLRPKELLKKREQFDGGQASQSDLTPVEDTAIDDIVKVQLDCGYHALSDGEYRRHMFYDGLFSTLNGFREIRNPTIDIFRTYLPDIAAFMESNHTPAGSLICDGKISHSGKSAYIPQLEYLKKILPKEKWSSIKMTMPAPEWFHLRYKEGKAYTDDAYSSDEEYFNDIAKAYQQELQMLYDAGCRNVQIDDPNMAYFCSESMLAGWKDDSSNRITSEQQLDAYIKLYNDCVAKRPSDMHIGLHICRGNFVNSRHFSEGGYDRIAIKLFQSLNVDTYYLEYDTERAGGFEPLEHLPKNKSVILGVVTSKFPPLEDKEKMKERVQRAADFVARGSGQTREQALERLGVSPQCGFASHSEGNALGYDDMVNKLKLVRQIADEVWPGQP